MYVNITGSANNKDVYIYQSYRKENGKTSSRIYRKLGKFNDLLARFDGGDRGLGLFLPATGSEQQPDTYHQKGLHPFTVLYGSLIISLVVISLNIILHPSWFCLGSDSYSPLERA